MPLEETNFTDYLSEQTQGILYKVQEMQRLACINSTSEISIHIMHCTYRKHIQREINACKGMMAATYTGVHDTTINIYVNTQRVLIAVHTHIRTQI